MAIPLFQSVNMFLGLREQNVVFCLDISGSMYNSLNVIKEHLIHYLLEQSVLANLNLSRMFNLIAFSSEIYPWADRLVLWNSATVNNAINWIKDLETKTGTNTLDALMTAFQDQDCNSVVLVTDDLPDQDAYSLLNQISLVSRGRPVHCIYILNGNEEDRSAVQFLQNLATITRGSLKIVSIGRFGVEKITPLSLFDLTSTFQLSNLSINANSFPAQVDTKVTNSVHSGVLATTSPPMNNDSLSGTNFVRFNYLPADIKNTQITSKYQLESILPCLNYTYPKWLVEPSNYSYPSFHSYPRVLLTQEGKIPLNSVAWSRYRPVKVLYDGTVVGLTYQDSNFPFPFSNDIAYTPDAGSLLLHKHVVARSSLDGYYYLGKVINQVLAHRFTIQFGPNTHGKYRDCFYQDTAIYDIIHYEDAIRHPIRTNEKVLAPIDGVERYAPAEVLEGFEKRDSTDEKERATPNTPLTVRFGDGKTRTLGAGQAIWLPDAMYERIKFELNLPSNARKYLEEYSEGFPQQSLPGYPIINKTNDKSIQSVVMPRMVYDIWPYFVPFYPIYSKLLYPALSLMPEFKNGITTNNLEFSLPSTTATPSYLRQIRANRPVVNADCVNQFVIGSTLTPNELDAKIRQQIQKHEHLLRSSKKNRDQSPNEACETCHCNTGLLKELHSSKAENNYHYLNNYQHHNHNHHPVSNHQPTINENNSQESLSDHKDNKHYEFYRRMVQDLYDSCREDHLNSRQSEHKNNMGRSKSVTFCRSKDAKHCHCDSDSDYEVINYEKEFRKSTSTNTDVSFAKREKKKKSRDEINNKMLDRFGNPKANIGLPDRPLHRSQSALDSLDNSMLYKSSENLRDKFRREKSEEREKTRQENLLAEQKRQEARDQFYRSVSIQNSQFEKRRTEGSEAKRYETDLARKERNSGYQQSFENSKVNVEDKEKKKIDHLRHEVSIRNENRLNQLHNEALKEANKIAFKRTEQGQRNQLYHDRLLFEEAVRMTYQKQALINHNKNTSHEMSREKKALKSADLNRRTKENQIAKRTNEFLRSKN